MEIKKGTITDYNYTTKYDDDGYEYRLFNISVDGKKYTSKGPKDLYLKEGTLLIFEVSGTEILSGFCPSEKIKWGKNARKLKGETVPSDKYTFIHGTIIEKRREVANVPNISNSDIDTRVFKKQTTFTVVLENDIQFRTSREYGEKLKPNDKLAVVLEENWAVLLKNTQTGKYIGWNTPYFLIFLVMCVIALNLAIPYAKQNYPGLLINPGATYVVLNGVLGLILIGNISGYFGKRHIKRFMLENIRTLEK